MLKKISLISFVVFFVSLIAVGYVSAQDIATPSASAPSPSGIVDCFDYYKFGSVQVPVTSSKSITVSGTKMSFTGSIKNDNPYPVVDGAVFVKIFRTQKEMNANGPYVVDQFIAKDNISIDAKSNQKLDFTWDVPAYAKSGEYQVATFFVSGDKFNLLGLPFTDDVIGNRFDFKVIGEQEKIVEFNKNSVKINGSPYFFAGFPAKIETTQDAYVTTELLNQTDQTQTVNVTWKTYSWSAQQEQNLLNTKTETITLSKGEKRNLSHTVTDKTHSVYLLQAEVKYKDTKSIQGIRFTRKGIDIPRLNFPAVTSFPLTKDTPSTLFSCFHNTNSGDIDEGSLTLKLEDKNGKIFHEYKYDGSITSAMMGLKSDFTPSKNYDSFSVVAELSKGGKVVDSARMKYDCKDIDPSKCFPVTSMNIYVAVIGGAVLLFLLLILAIAIKKRDHKVVIALGLLIILVIGVLYFISNNKKVFGEWSTIQYTASGDGSVTFDYIEPKYLLANASGDSGTRSNGFDENRLYQVFEKNMSMKVAYNVTSSKPAGANLIPGETIRFTFTPLTSQAIDWKGTGGEMGTPFGHWVPNAGGVPADLACKLENFLDNGVGGNGDGIGECENNINHQNKMKCDGVSGADDGKMRFINLNIAPPTKTLTNTSGLTCGPMSAGGNIDCKVASTTSQITINPTFSFGSTVGKLYLQWAYGRKSAMVRTKEFMTCHTNSLPLYASASIASSQPSLTSPFVLNIPALTIPYSYTVSPSGSCEGNTAPTNPTVAITSPILVNQPTTVTFSSTDAQSQPISYEIDWGNGTFIPESSPVERTMTTEGTTTIRVRAIDTCGLSSGVVSGNIVVNPSTAIGGAVFMISCSVNNSPVATGTPVTFTATPYNNIGSVLYTWISGGTGNPKTFTYNTLGRKVETVRGKDIEDRVATGTCSVWVGCDDSHNEGDDAGCINGFGSAWHCVGTTWATSTTNVPCSSKNPCGPIDGITLQHGDRYTFFKSRIAKICDGKEFICADGTFIDGNDIYNDTGNYKYKACVEPGFDEF